VRYLITGGSGCIGSRLTEILAARDDVDGIVDLDVRQQHSLSRASATAIGGSGFGLTSSAFTRKQKWSVA